MGRKRLVIVLWLLILVFIFLFGQAHGSSRNSHMFKVNPKSHRNSPRSFFGALPKAMPIPPSGPSKKHNDIGLQSSRRSP
ncbi:Inflorescence deficient in abscission-like 2, putative [Theobroma cacao]|uniref:Inflorescence deficient in abscission-like 2, putative n=1 Tax=Theobroma cacao TaxID=3641 RepID=A0A061FIH6_THECC|nr:Inflorescence deficient in abscission-like 2, putative [Theobroma cacao]